MISKMIPSLIQTYISCKGWKRLDCGITMWFRIYTCLGGGSLCKRQAVVLATVPAKRGPRHINRISPLAGWLAWLASWPFEVTGPLTPPGEAWDLFPLLTHTCQDRNTHIFAYSHSSRHARTNKRMICSSLIKHP